MPGSWGALRAGDGNRPIRRLADDFADGVLNPQWRTFTGAGTSAVEDSGAYTITISDGVTAGNSLFAFPWDATGGSLAVELVDAGVQEAGLQTWVALQVDESNQVAIIVAGGFIGCWEQIAGVFTDHGFTAYDPEGHLWFRIREDSGTTYWETGPDGESWTTLASAANPIALDNVTVSLSANTFLTLGTSKTVSFGHVAGGA